MSQSDPFLGKKIREYEIIDLIGRGGMGAVYKARHTYLLEERAIKVIRGNLSAQDKFVERFIREARILTKLKHPNLVQLYEFGTLDEETFFMVMELIRGESLLDRMRRLEKIPVVESVKIACAAARGLHSAHEQGIVHRDISPDNIVICKDEDGNETPKIIDFGIAKPVLDGVSQRFTDTNMFIGKVEYCSPEQCGMLEEGEQIDRRSDIYSLAVTMYFMLSGKLPFYAATPHGFIYKHMSEAPRSLSTRFVSGDFPSQLDRVILKALSKKREDRQSTMKEFADDLENSIGAYTPLKTDIRNVPIQPDVEEESDQPETEITPSAAPRQTPMPPPPPPRAAAPAPVGSTVVIQRRGLRIAILSLLGIVLFAGGYYYYQLSSKREIVSQPPPVALPKTKIGIAYESSKQKWLEPALAEFEKTEEGKKIDVELIPLTSLEGARAVLTGDQRIVIWFPSSSLAEELVEDDWQAKFGKSPILSKKEMAITPMVFVMWESRYQYFAKKYGKVNFKTIVNALETKGWQEIAAKPEWGSFDFGMADPAKSMNGLTTLLLLANEYYQKPQALTIEDIQSAQFQQFLKRFKGRSTILGGSTGDLIQQMLLQGPPSIDAAFLYENVAVDYLKDAEGRWGKLHFIYPEYNLWNENPFCVLNTSWVSKDRLEAAQALEEFLLSKPIQKEALARGFRAVDTSIPFMAPGSPFDSYSQSGVQIDIGTTCKLPEKNVIKALLDTWRQL